MSYREKVLTRIEAIEDRQADRKALWQAMSESFEKEGASGIAAELAKEMKDIEEKFAEALAALDTML